MGKVPVRLGIIGCGLMGREIASAVLRYPHLLETTAHPELVAVADLNPNQMTWFRDNIPTVRTAVTDYRELLADPAVDAVYCAVPHHLHQTVYGDVLAAGKALLGEKPFGIDQSANRAIRDVIARHPGQLVRASSEFPYFPGALRVAEWVANGELGRIIEAEAGFWHSSDLDPQKPINWKRRVETNGEYGAMGDLGLHVVHLPLRMGVQFDRVFAQLSNIIRERPDRDGRMVACDTWDNADLSVDARLGDDRFPMRLSTKRIAPGHGNTWFVRLVGTKGGVAFSTEDPKLLWTMRFQGGEQAWQRRHLEYRSVFPAITGPIFEFGFSDALLQMTAAFVEEWVGHDPGNGRCATPDETAASHALFTAALRSHASGRAEPVTVT